MHQDQQHTVGAPPPQGYPPKKKYPPAPVYPPTQEYRYGQADPAPSYPLPHYPQGYPTNQGPPRSPKKKKDKK
ncbi:hypothetical protein EUTSA_v10010880mg [Eutrema salsugineum]|uniref:Uncharacterized protein n=1 Tax=Eutrema salsugineum TaxID=72664 RepID=V4L5F2_EUTSA|nr:hypothetical protein EUTSA_v10010880mg [Eutrema salsugineum]